MAALVIILILIKLYIYVSCAMRQWLMKVFSIFGVVKISVSHEECRHEEVVLETLFRQVFNPFSTDLRSLVYRRYFLKQRTNSIRLRSGSLRSSVFFRSVRSSEASEYIYKYKVHPYNVLPLHLCCTKYKRDFLELP